jgi:hypothetical protein
MNNINANGNFGKSHVSRRVDHTGKKFGKLTVLEMIWKYRETTKMRCKCDCGNEIILPAYKVVSGVKTHCGCEKSKSVGRGGKRNNSGRKKRTYTVNFLKNENIPVEKLRKCKGCGAPIYNGNYFYCQKCFDIINNAEISQGVDNCYQAIGGLI